MAFNLFGAPKRRSRSSGGGGGKALDTVILVGGLGILGVGAYFVLKSGKGFEEALDTGGDFLKGFVDAANSTGDWIGDGSYWLQKQLGIGSGGGSKKSEEKGITDKLAGAVGGYSKGIEKEIQKNEDRSIISREDIGNAIGGAGEALGNAGCRFQKLFNPGLSCR